MIKKIKPSLSEKIILFFLVLLLATTLSTYFIIKNKCLFIKNFDPKNINFKNPKNIVILNAPCGNVIIELYPEVSPNGVKRFINLTQSYAYDDVAFHRVIKDKLVQAGDLEFGKKGALNYGKIGTGKSGLGTIKSEIDGLTTFIRDEIDTNNSLNYEKSIKKFFLNYRVRRCLFQRQQWQRAFLEDYIPTFDNRIFDSLENLCLMID